MIKNFYELQPQSGKPKQMVILLHGVGSNGRDLISLAPYFQREVPQAVFISPDAPAPYDMAPPGFDAWQWFSLQERTYEKRLEGVQMVAPQVHLFIDEQLKKYDLPASKLALVGFSQGTMTSLYAGPRYKEKIAGVLGYSGALIWEKEIPATVHKIPVHIIHGDADDVVPVEAYHDAKKRLEETGFSVSGQVEQGLPHSINENGIESGAKFLKAVLV
jgi:phospholipase/carboxylesterase